MDSTLSRPLVMFSAAFAALAGAAPLWADCGLPESGSCVVPHEAVGCADAACCTTVCHADPFCCDVGWDEYCAGGAVENCGIPSPIIHVMSFGADVTLPGGLEVSPCDLAAFHTGTGQWSTFFDGDDVGLTGQTVIAAARTADGELLMTTAGGGSVTGLAGGPAENTYEAFDLIRFTPTELGENTAGSWTFHFDGSDVGLSGNTNRTIRGVTVLPDGTIGIAINSSANLPGGVSVNARDIARFEATSLGSETAGSWALHFRGSNVGLSTNNERLDSMSSREDGSITFSTTGSFAVPGLSGGRADFFRFIPTSLGETTAGSFVPVLSPVAMSLPAGLNPRAGFEILITYPDGPRPGQGGGGGGGEEPPSCGDPTVGDCCATSLTPFCSDAACCELVCAADPVCCSVAWDEYCVAAATNQCVPCMLPAQPVLAFGTATTLPGGIAVNPCDLASYDPGSGSWSIFFDGDDVGLANRIIRAATSLPNGDLLFAMDVTANMPGLVGGPNGNAYERFDVLRFTPTTLGETTAGTWTFHFDGSDVGLGGNSNMAIRSLATLPDGSLVIATRGNCSLPDAGPVTGNDLVRFTPASLGSVTAGTWSLYFDGSDVGLSTTDEQLDSSFVTSDGTVVLSTRNSFTVDGLSGGNGDLFDFVPGSLGAATSGSFATRFTAAQMGIPSTVNPQALFLFVPTIDIGDRPLTPVLFDGLPSATVSATAVEDGHAEYIIVYQGVDPNATATGLINAQLVIESIRKGHGDNPSGYGVLDFESPFIERLEAGPGHPDWQMTVDTVVGALQAVKAEFPNVRWTMYSMPIIRYWLPPYYSWADAPAAVKEEAFTAALVGFDPVLRECDWLNPSTYDRYELATYSAGQHASKTAQETAHRRANVEVCNRFNASSGLPRKPIIPMVSPMFWKVGQISYNMKQIPLEEILRDSVRPLIDEGADSVGVWTGFSYWVRAATSEQDLGLGQLESRHAITQDFLEGVAPADWTAPGLRESLSEIISEHIRTRLNEIRSEIYDLLVGSAGP
jgi:hypothetical protein